MKIVLEALANGAVLATVIEEEGTTERAAFTDSVALMRWQTEKLWGTGEAEIDSFQQGAEILRKYPPAPAAPPREHVDRDADGRPQMKTVSIDTFTGEVAG